MVVYLDNEIVDLMVHDYPWTSSPSKLLHYFYLSYLCYWMCECVIGAPPQISTPYSVKTKTLNKFFNCFPAESHQVAFQFPYWLYNL